MPNQRHVHAIHVGSAEVADSAPRTVTGYTNHALEEMAADRIGKPQVENLVATRYSNASWQKKQKTWKYTDGRIVVILNTRGSVVTAWRR